VIDAITPEIEAQAGDAGSGLSKGGMKTKLMAAKTATAAGCTMAICHGAAQRPLLALQNGANATWFTAMLDPQAARKRWIAAMKPRGAVQLDAGAVSALTHGNSLLPAGVHSVTGSFGRGDPVSIQGPDGHQLGLGLCRYTAAETQTIKGHKSQEIEALLGYPGRAALIHRDDMAL
jgi:glutamate 5-kinase